MKRFWRYLTKALSASVALGLLVVSPAYAVDLTGNTVVAEGHQVVVKRNMSRESVTWRIEVYFGKAGNRFIYVHKENAVGTTNFIDSYDRILIPVGKNKAIKWRKDGKFAADIRLEQSDDALKVSLLSRGKDTRHANETFIWLIGINSTGCKLQDYKYVPDPGLSYFSVKATEGICTLTRGVPDGLADQ
ncbi:hypothetical protein [Devosia sp. CN2-171]|uniref:hypothetical protein n=1 Tax=Devosia sp. CN2-171 TaxID=3400909 RepID=UPI003BF88C46